MLGILLNAEDNFCYVQDKNINLLIQLM